MTDSIDTVMSTCLITMYPRAHTQLFDDPFAKAGMKLFDKSENAGEGLLDMPNRDRALLSVVIRTKWIDERIEKYVKENLVSQLVIIGCGMDGRAYRMTNLNNVDVFHVDQEPIINLRQNIINSSGICLKSKSTRDVSINLATSLSSLETLLTEKGYNKSLPSIWIIEGVLMYLTKQETNDLLTLIKQLNGSFIIGTHFVEKTINITRNENNAMMKTWKTGITDSFQQEIKEIGWMLKQLDNVGSTTASYNIKEVPLIELFDSNRKIIDMEYSPTVLFVLSN